jgi:hypothetical protein
MPPSFANAAMNDQPDPKFLVGPAQLVFIAAALGFALLLSHTGWTWPLEGVAAVLPVAAYLVFT